MAKSYLSRFSLKRISFLAFFVLFAPSIEHCDTEAQERPSAAAPYHQLREVNESLVYAPDVSESAGSFDPGWWKQMVVKPLRRDESAIPLSLEETLIAALSHSQQIQVFSELPLIRETAIIEADAAFDWHAFIDSRWDDLSEPTGNVLTAGPGTRRFDDHDLSGSAGLRRRTLTGGTLEAAQQFGYQRNNSTFFVPNPQGTARLSLSFTQPLLRGRGKQYNTSLTVLAAIDKEVAEDEFRRQVESHLLEVARSYWALYLERAVLYQKINSYIRGERVYNRLARRRNIDAPVTQIVSAEAAIKQRKSELERARAAVKNAESRLRSLVNNPCFDSAELIPTDAPIFDAVTADASESVTIAMQHRWEVGQAIKQIKAAGVRLNMSKHELMPILDLVTEAYASGLEDRGDAGRAWNRQFDTGTPSYSIGLQFEVPISNRAALARHQRRQLEVRQLHSQYAATLETIRHEVEVGVRELQTSLRELSTKERAMTAQQMHLDSVSRRWERLPGEDLNASLALENMLTAQERLAEAEFEYLASQLTYNLSIVNLKRVMGLLLCHEQVSIERGLDSNLPIHVLDKPDLRYVRRLPPVSDSDTSRLLPPR